MGGGAIGRGYRAGMPHLRPPRIADEKGAGQEDEGGRAEGGERGGVRGGQKWASINIFIILNRCAPALNLSMIESCY